MKTADLIVIGGGIVGLATAHIFLRQYPDKTILILEKEDRVASHQSGHNSGVLHSGIYYKPGSIKAATCREGKKEMEEFCAEQGIRFELCGKVIVALDHRELARLEALYERGRANGVNCELIERPRLLEIEPHAAGIKAIHVPETGIVDYKQVCERLAALVRARGHELLTRAKVVGLRETPAEVVVKSEAGEFAAKYVINCAGLHSDRVASLVGEPVPLKIVPFRGEYFKLKAEAEYLCGGLIYPVPDPQFPFLGVHFTRMIEGGVECGPNAVLALAREGYRKTDIDVRDLLETLTYSGFIKLARRYWQTGAGEIHRSFSKAAFARALQRLVPLITADQLVPAGAGIRAQAVALDGAMLDDFSFHERPRVLNVINAPSPGATASLSIAKLIVKRLAARF
jgi:(S)-2-hydroxyglutarate dehydrogenase